MPQNDDTNALLSLMTLGILPVVLYAIVVSTIAGNGLWWRFRAVALLAIVLITIGCSFVQVKDGEWCSPPYPGGPSDCTHTLVSETRQLDAKAFEAWLYDPVDPKLCGSVDAFAAQKAAVEELCAQAKNCIYLGPEPDPSPAP